MKVEISSILFVMLFFVCGHTFASEIATKGIIFETFPVVKLQLNNKLSGLLSDQDFEEPYKGHKKDLNGDGIDDYILESPQGLCGTGGCVYLLIDGKSCNIIGEFLGGYIIISDKKTGQHSVVKRLRYSGPEAAQIETYIFSGTKYRLKSTKNYYGKALEIELAGLKRVNRSK